MYSSDSREVRKNPGRPWVSRTFQPDSPHSISVRTECSGGETFCLYLCLTPFCKFFFLFNLDLSGGPKPTQPTITTTNSTAPPSGGFIFGGGIGQPLQTIATQQQPAVPSTTPSLLTTTQTPIQTVTTQSNTISSTPTKPSALAFVAPTG